MVSLRVLPLLLACAVLMVWVAPDVAAAQPAASCGDVATEASMDLVDLLGLDPADSGRVETTSTCTATCWDGTTRTCTGNTCTAQDSRCKVGERGYCVADGGLRNNCPPCLGRACSTSTTCDNGGTAACTGYNNCFSVSGCYAYCEAADDSPGDGFYVWCIGESPATCPLP